MLSKPIMVKKELKKKKKYSQLKQKVKTLKSRVHVKYKNKMINKSQSISRNYILLMQSKIGS